MDTTIPAICPTPQAIDALSRLAAGEATRDPAVADTITHVARCPQCATALRAARFANRFSLVLTGSSVVSMGTGGLVQVGNEELDRDETGSRGFAGRDKIVRTPQAYRMPVVPGYRLEAEISRGAQGVVYDATQLGSNQRVAVKVLHDAGNASPKACARFAREIQIAAALQHPGIVRLLDSLTLADGRDALIMERIDGVSFGDWVAGLKVRDQGVIASVLAQIADALHHAHQRGVIHRDLKPSNIMIDESGRPRVLDFGVARWTDGVLDSLQERVTLTGEFAGTLAYAAPEQVGALRSSPDIRSDVYALGVIGYEALAGQLPYLVRGSLETTIWNIINATPARIPVNRANRDLATVLSTAIAKEPDRRYQTCADLARDLRYTLVGEAIDARRDSRVYVVRKSIRRYRYAYAFAALVFTFVLTMLGVLLTNNARLTIALHESTIERLRSLAATGSRSKAEEILWPELDQVMPREADPIKAIWNGSLAQRRSLWAFMELQGPARCLSRTTVPGPKPKYVKPTDDGGFAFERDDGSFTIYSASESRFTELPVRMPSDMQSTAISLNLSHVVFWKQGELECYSSGGSGLAAWSGFDAARFTPTRAHVPTIPVLDLLLPLPSMYASREYMTFDAIEQGLQIYSLPGLKLVRELHDAVPNQAPWHCTTKRVLAYLTKGGRIVIIDPITGELLAPELAEKPCIPVESIKPPSGVRSAPRVVLNESMSSAVVTLHDSTFSLDLSHEAIANGTIASLIPVKLGVRVNAGLNAEGNIVAMNSFGDSRLRLFDAKTWNEWPSLSGHDVAVALFTMPPGGKRILTVDYGMAIRVWDTPGHGWRTPITRPTQSALDPSFDWKSERVYFGDSERTMSYASMRAQDLSTQVKLANVTGLTISVASNDGLIACAGLGEEVRMHTAAPSGQAATTPTEPRVIRPLPGQRVQSIRFSPDGKKLAMCTMEGSVAILDPRLLASESSSTGSASIARQIEPQAALSSIRFAKDGKQLYVAARDGRVHVLDAASLATVRVIEVVSLQLRSLSVNPDGASIIAVGNSGQLHKIDPTTGTITSSSRLTEDAIFCVEFHPSGKTVAFGDRGGGVTIIDLASYKPLARFSAGSPVTSLCFDPSGDKLMVSAIGKPIERWNFAALASTLKAVRPVRKEN